MVTGRKMKERRKKRTVAAATARRRERAERGFTDMFNLPKGVEMFGLDSTGTKRVDIVPYTVGTGNPNADEGDFYWERTFFAHRSIGINEDWFVCPARTSKKKCPICEYAAKLQNDPDVDEDTVKALLPSRRMLLNVRDLKKDPNKVKVWHVSHAYFGQALDEALTAAYEDENDNMDNFCDPEGGYYVKCLAEKGWQGHGYSVERVDFVPRKDDLDDDILEQAVCLDEILIVKSYDELKEALFAGEEEGEADASSKKGKGHRDKDKSQTRQPRQERVSRKEEWEDYDKWEEAKEEEEEDEETEEEPQRKKAKKKRNMEPKDEWEDEPEEEPEDEPEEEPEDEWEDEEPEEEEPRQKKTKKKLRK